MPRRMLILLTMFILILLEFVYIINIILGVDSIFALTARARTTDISKLRQLLGKAKNVMVLTGAGISADSGVPTFRGENGMWKNKSLEKLSYPSAFQKDPATVWEFYHYRRELVLTKEPNAAHLALVKCEDLFRKNNRSLTIITTNVDGLHQRAGSKNVIELHGSLYKTKCTSCNEVEENFDSPICSALKGKELIFERFEKSKIKVEDLPHCKKCDGLLRPAIVWFGESIESKVSSLACNLTYGSDLALIIGSSSLVYPAALYGTEVANRGMPVAEFNVEPAPYTFEYQFFLEGRASETVPKVLDNLEIYS